MSLVTKFAARDPGPAARMAGFVAHLRDNGLRLGVGETGAALDALTHINAANPYDSRRALKSVFTGCTEEAAQFDGLFNSFWMNGGRVKTRVTATPSQSENVQSSREESEEASSGTGDMSAPGGVDGEAESDGEGKLVAMDVTNLFKKDLRDLVRPEDIAEAEKIALRLGAALRDRRSRRRKAARKGDQIHFRKVMRKSLATGGEPFVLPKLSRQRKRWLEPCHIWICFAQPILWATWQRSRPKWRGYDTQTDIGPRIERGRRLFRHSHDCTHRWNHFSQTRCQGVDARRWNDS